MFVSTENSTFRFLLGFRQRGLLIEYTGRIAACMTVRHDRRIGIPTFVPFNNAYTTSDARFSRSLLNIRYQKLECYRHLRRRGLSNAEINTQESSSPNTSENALRRT